MESTAETNEDDDFEAKAKEREQALIKWENKLKWRE